MRYNSKKQMLKVEVKNDMGRPSKDFKFLNCKIERSIAEELDKFIEETGLSKTVTVERALKMYFEQFGKTGKI